MKVLIYGGQIYTMATEGETVEAVLVSDDRIEKTGSYEELRQLADKEIDLAGRTMYPGLVDSHLHLIQHGEKLMRVDLSKIDSSDEMKQQLIRSTEGHSGDEWFIGEGWNENNFPDRKFSTVANSMPSANRR